MKATDLSPAYIAGILDGEGWIGVRPTGRLGSTGRRYYATAIAVGMCDPVIPAMLHERYGGRLQTEGRSTRALHRWTVSADQAAAVAREVLPFLVVKRRQAEILLAIQAGRIRAPGNARAARLTDEKWAEVEGLYAALRALNARGARAPAGAPAP